MLTSPTSMSDSATGKAAIVKICVNHSVITSYLFARVFVLANWTRAEDFKQPSRFAHSGLSYDFRLDSPVAATLALWQQ
jgi:hypothetical protein